MNQQPTKTPREDDVNPSIFVSGPSISTLVNEPITENSEHSMQVIHEIINKEHLALKLNRLKEKSARYDSHKDFLSCCIKDCFIPKGLKLELEPTIGNFDQEFIDNRFSKRKDYSFDLMKDIIKFCDKAIAETKPAIQNIEAKLKASMEREEFSEIDKTTKTKKQRSIYFNKENALQTHRKT